ncbi:hypothetical protein [Streptomyces sp. NPDC088910]|uniref:hypothetical protein n=1 Tax=Streptomyces sp. NPDC088910 TaxID=3365911 RepID=UPI0037F71F9F
MSSSEGRGAEAVTGEFARSATREQAAVFGAACAERAAAILFWVVAGDGRTADLEAYAKELEALWTPGTLTEGRGRIEGMRELVEGDGASGARAFAYQGAVALHTAMGAEPVLGCSSVLRDMAFRLGRRCGADLLTGEDETQRRDIADLTSGAADGAIRERSREAGRRWLALAAGQFGGRPGETGR